MPKIPKRNKEYWQKRFKAIEKQNHGKGLKSLAYITLEYEKAEKELNDKINLWYERFAKNNGLTLAEAKKVLNAKELKEFKWSVDDYIKYAEENELNGQWVKELENASARVHIERFEALKLDMKATIEKLYSVQSGTLFKTLGKVYSDTYYRSCFEIQKAFGIGWNVAKVDENRLKKVLSTPWTVDSSTFSARLWSNREKLVSEVQSTITRGLMTGKTPDKMTAEISKAMGSSKRNAGRIVMTETAAISAMGQKDAYEELDVEEFEIVETLDGSTCEVCGELDGKHFPQSEYKIGVTVPPFHPWCRGCTAPYFEDMKGISTRFARDVKTGKAYEVPNDMTYSEWKKKQDEAAEIFEKPLKISDNSVIIDTYKGKPWKVEGNPEISIDTQKAVETATKKISKDFRSLEKYSEPIIFGDTGDGALAVNRFNGKYGTNRITLSQAAFSNPEKLLQTLEDNYHTGLSYKTQCIESLVAHEMGHNAHMALALQRCNFKYGEPLDISTFAMFSRECDKISQEIYLAAFTDESFYEIQSQCVLELGKVTYCDAHELIAQSFGNYYYGDKKSRIAKAIVEYFMKELF